MKLSTVLIYIFTTLAIQAVFYFMGLFSLDICLVAVSQVIIHGIGLWFASNIPKR